MRVHTFVVAFVVLLSSIFANTAEAGWHDWSQASRNQAIVDQTAYWSDGSQGGQCKAWVQSEIVPDASGLGGLIPANHTNYCYWQAGSYVVGRSAYIEYALPGEIIQMDLSSGYGGGGPHTAIVIANGPYGVTFKESNWCVGNCEDVGTRYVTYSAFYSQVDCYTIYYVL